MANINELIDKYSTYIKNIIRGFKTLNKTEQEDLYIINIFNLWICCQKYKEDKNAKFGTFLVRKVKWSCLSFIKCRKKHKYITQDIGYKVKDIDFSIIFSDEEFLIAQDLINNIPKKAICQNNNISSYQLNKICKQIKTKYAEKNISL